MAYDFWSNTDPTVIKAINDLAAQVTALDARVTALEKNKPKDATIDVTVQE